MPYNALTEALGGEADVLLEPAVGARPARPTRPEKVRFTTPCPCAAASCGTSRCAHPTSFSHLAEEDRVNDSWIR